MPLMERFYLLLGRIFFPGQQAWRQVRNAKTLVLVVAFSLVLALIVAKFLRIYYNHER
ncbi:MAG TPA: hypothetical protein VG347_06485 [Verrucomicrobiae bacterium]|nr:hypothetical protein [Verrucomicrobiae bacterium]